MKDIESWFGIKTKYMNYLLIVSLLVLIIPSFFYEGLLESYWPYLVLVIFLLIVNNFRDPKIGLALIISLISLMVIMQAFFYFILPIYNNYQPIPTPQKMQIFDLAGKFQVSYYPDIPESGDEIVFYLDICDVGLTNCTKCEFCYLSGNFINEKGERKELFSNISINKSYPTKLGYFGKRINLELDFNGIDSRYRYFHIPRLNFYQSIIHFLNEHPLFKIISIISLLAFIITFPYSLYKIVIYMKKNYKILTRKQIKRKVDLMLNS